MSYARCCVISQLRPGENGGMAWPLQTEGREAGNLRPITWTRASDRNVTGQASNYRRDKYCQGVIKEGNTSVAISRLDVLGVRAEMLKEAGVLEGVTDMWLKEVHPVI